MLAFIYISNSIDAYFRPLVSCRLYTTIIRQKKLVGLPVTYQVR